MATITINETHRAKKGVISILPDNAVAITKSDTDVYDPPITVYVGGAGIVAAVPAGDPTGSPVQVTVPAGGYVPFRCYKVMATDTSATLMVGVG